MLDLDTIVGEVIQDAKTIFSVRDQWTQPRQISEQHQAHRRELNTNSNVLNTTRGEEIAMSIVSPRHLGAALDSICGQCRRQISRTALLSGRQYSTAAVTRPNFSAEFFRWNRRLRDINFATKQIDGVSRGKAAQSTVSISAEQNMAEQSQLGAKRRRRTKGLSEQEKAQLYGSNARKIVDEDGVIPPDASAQLSTNAASLPIQSFRRKFALYLALTKPRLTFLIILTTTAAYGMYPVPAMLDPAAVAVPSLSPITLLFLTSGTFLTCASANAFNMLIEPEHDAKMSRTRNRPLVRKLLTGRAALVFAIACGAVGTAELYFGVNPTTAFLGAGNIVLYAAVYTPLKRIHPINTWVGAVVGAIPPLMGWTAAGGQCASESGDWHELLFGPDSAGGWALAGLLFFWQIPHFAALSWTIRHEYAAAGYRMLCSSNPRLDAFFSLVCAAGLQQTTTKLYEYKVIEPWAYMVMIPANAWITWEALKFYWHKGHKGTARKLFWASVWYLPIVLLLGMIGKQGLGSRVYSWFTGEELEDDEEWEYYDSKPAKEEVAQTAKTPVV
jgi:protoheme IX farnesyltransferase